MRLKDWFRTYWKTTAGPDAARPVPCPSCRSERAALTIPASPEFSTRVCLTCDHEWSIPTGIRSHGLPLWEN
jgi:hypothetical protein